MAGSEDIDTPPPQDISNVFAAADLSSQSSYDIVNNKRAWHRAKRICSSILSSGESPDAQSRALYIALNHRQIASIMVVNGTILQKRYANVITQHEQKKKKYYHMQHLLEINGKKTEDRKTLFMSNIFSIVTSP